MLFCLPRNRATLLNTFWELIFAFFLFKAASDFTSCCVLLCFSGLGCSLYLLLSPSLVSPFCVRPQRFGAINFPTQDPAVGIEAVKRAHQLPFLLQRAHHAKLRLPKQHAPTQPNPSLLSASAGCYVYIYIYIYMYAVYTPGVPVQGLAFLNLCFLN